MFGKIKKKCVCVLTNFLIHKNKKYFLIEKNNMDFHIIKKIKYIKIFFIIKKI